MRLTLCSRTEKHCLSCFTGMNPIPENSQAESDNDWLDGARRERLWVKSIGRRQVLFYVPDKTIVRHQVAERRFEK